MHISLYHSLSFTFPFQCLSLSISICLHFHVLLYLGMPVDVVPDNVPDPPEGPDAPRARPAAPCRIRPRDERARHRDLHVARVPGEH